MIIDGKKVKSLKTFVHTSPVDTRIVLGYFQSGTHTHAQTAIMAAKRSFVEQNRL